jgi:hypothetical protein
MFGTGGSGKVVNGAMVVACVKMPAPNGERHPSIATATISPARVNVTART